VQVAEGARHGDVGCHVPPLFVGKHGLYLDASTFVRIPLAHALLYGPASLLLALPCISSSTLLQGGCCSYSGGALASVHVGHGGWR
jgi:hypothetical protein